MKIRNRFLIFALHSGFAAIMPGQVWFSDGFTSTSLDSARWVTNTPYSDSVVRLANGYVEVEDAGRITTVTSFSGTIEITGRIQLSSNSKNNSKLVLRTDGSQFGTVVKGVAVQFSPQLDNGSLSNQLGIFTIGAPSDVSAALSTPINLDMWYDFRIIDRGTSVELYWNGATTVSLVLLTSFSAGNRISFLNREGSGAGSSISNNGKGRLDYLTVSAIPAPGAADILSGLVANFEFGGDFTDSSLNQFFLTPVNGVTRFVEDRRGVAGGAVDFVSPATGDDTFLKGTGPYLANQSLSVAFWIKKNYSGTSGVGVFGLRTDGAAGEPGNNLTVFLDYGGAVRFTFWYDDFDLTNTLLSGVWYHLAFTYDNATRTRVAYINGIAVASKTAVRGFSGGNTLLISAKYTSLDSFRFYNRALSAADVLALKNLEASPVVPPVISAQPVAQSVATGGTATFSVTASGVSALSYQWQKDGLALPGATGAALTLSNVQPVHLGDYSVIVSQSSGGVTSSSASLTISGQLAEIWRGLIAYYPFNGTANDQSPFGNHSTPAGNFQYLTSGLSDGALRVIGDNSLFYAGGGHVLLPLFGSYLNSGFTFSMWVKDEVIGRDPVGASDYLSCGILDLPRYVIALNNNNASRPYLTFNIDTGLGGAAHLDAAEVTRETGTLSSFASAWKHLVITYSPGRFAAFLNGTKIGERSITFTGHPLTKASLGRGWWSGGNASAARMSVTYDNVRVYSRALSDSDVQLLYSSEAPVVGPSIATQPIGQTIAEGQRAVLGVTAIGSTPISYQWTKNGTPISGATGASYAIEAVRISDSGNYSVTITNPAGVTTSTAAVLTVKSANPGRLSNLSIRTAAGAGNGTLIVGFSLGGSGTSGSTSILSRVSGPALAQFGVTGTLPDPFLSLYDGGRLVGSSDNWGGVEAVSTAASAVGAFAFPAASKDAALLSSLPGSGFTAQAFDSAGASGVALVEVYDTSATFSYTKPRLINLSARATAGSGGSTMIAGFFVKGETALTVLIRGIGPALTQFGVSGVLANPRLTLFRDTTLVAVNENWGDLGAATIYSTAASVGAFALPSGSLDSAILATLQPGSYTVQVSSADNATGVALIEVYEVP